MNTRKLRCPESIAPQELRSAGPAAVFAITSCHAKYQPCTFFSRDPALPGLAGGAQGLGFCVLRCLVALVGHRPRCLLAKHLGLLSYSLAYAPHSRAGRAAHARCGLVSRCAGQLRTAGFPACGAGACGWHASRAQPHREEPCPWAAGHAELAGVAPPVRLAGPDPAGDGCAAGRQGGGLPAQRAPGRRGLPGLCQHRRSVEPVRARHGQQRCAGPLSPDRATGVDCLRWGHVRRSRPGPPAGGGRTACRPADGCAPDRP